MDFWPPRKRRYKSAMAIEFEAKILNINPVELRGLLGRLGAVTKFVLHKQTRHVFDIESRGAYRKWIRLRSANGITTLAVKQIVGADISGVVELETRIEDYGDMLEMLQIMGFESKAYQENYREIYD